MFRCKWYGGGPGGGGRTREAEQAMRLTAVTLCGGDGARHALQRLCIRGSGGLRGSHRVDMILRAPPRMKAFGLQLIKCSCQRAALRPPCRQKTGRGGECAHQ